MSVCSQALESNKENVRAFESTRYEIDEYAKLFERPILSATASTDNDRSHEDGDERVSRLT